MKDPAAFWKFLFAIGVLVTGFFTFFPLITEGHSEVAATVHNIGQTPLDDDIYHIKSVLPPARYYVQHVQITFLPDGTLRNLYVNLISQPNAEGKRVSAQIHREKNSSYRIIYWETENAIQKGDLDFEDLHKLFTPEVIRGLIPQSSFAYVFMEGTPVLTDLTLKSEQDIYLLVPRGAHGPEYEPTLYKGSGYPYLDRYGYPFTVYIMHKESAGHDSSESARLYMLPHP